MDIKLNIINELRSRGYVQEITDEENLSKLFEQEPVTFYCGFDPTAESLHVGNLLPIKVIKTLINSGHKAIILLGTATGMIGDPSGKSQERILLEIETIEKNASLIEKQITKILSSVKYPNNVQIVKNGDWLKNISYIEILRDVGKHFSVNQMIARDSVKSRLTEREQGISYTEFSYMILQAYDFLYLSKNHSCTLQIGGSDQWGNIASGIDLIRRINNSKAFGLTIPLLMNSNGTKFGKSESGNIWLSEKNSSAYAFYQFWLNTADDDVENYLKLFTEIKLEEISTILKVHRESPEKRIAQKNLAKSVTVEIHGEIKTNNAEKASQILFSNDKNLIDFSTLQVLENEIKTFSINLSEIENLTLAELLAKVEISDSKSSARKLITNGGVSINNNKEADFNFPITKETFIEKKLLLLKIGKKNHVLVKLLSN
jgi:tyrosyl-tRNA synthetase